MDMNRIRRVLCIRNHRVIHFAMNFNPRPSIKFSDQRPSIPPHPCPTMTRRRFRWISFPPLFSKNFHLFPNATFHRRQWMNPTRTSYYRLSLTSCSPSLIRPISSQPFPTHLPSIPLNYRFWKMIQRCFRWTTWRAPRWILWLWFLQIVWLLWNVQMMRTISIPTTMTSWMTSRIWSPPLTRTRSSPNLSHHHPNRVCCLDR